jgi:predicted nucleic acid-binding protein
MNYFYDSSAIIEIINQNESFERFQSEVITTNTLNIAEIYFHLLKEHNEQTADYWINNIEFEFLEITDEIAVKAAKLRHKHEKENISYADCIGYETVLQNNLIFVTSDERFQDKDQVEYIK